MSDALIVLRALRGTAMSDEGLLRCIRLAMRS